MNRNIVVVGSSSGIGLEIVKLLANDNKNTIWALSRFTNDEPIHTLEQFSNVQIVRIDIASPNLEVELRAFVKQLSTIDILINNAGFLVNKPFSELSRSEIEQSFSTNIIGIMLLTQQLIQKKAQNGMHIVNISSMGGFQGSVKFPGLTAYASSKAALANFTEVFAEEYKETNITMNCLCLGAVQTVMLSKAFPGYEAPLLPNEMAEYIVDFALNGAKFFNGKIIPVSSTTP